MRASSLRSGPTANGTITTTIKKNSAPISAPPPTRTASRMSRNIRATNAVIAGPIFSSARALEADGAMRRGDDHAARVRWRRIKSASRVCEAASSAEVGSSSSQIARGTATSRAIDSRRRCPAER